MLTIIHRDDVDSRTCGAPNKLIVMSSEEDILNLISALPSMLRLQFVWVTMVCGMVGLLEVPDF